MVGRTVQAPPFQREHAQRLAREIQKMDRRLDVHFCYRRERWRIVEWVDAFNAWTHCFYWELEDGGFRHLPGTAEPLLAKLREIDWSKFKDMKETAVARDVIGRQLDNPRLELLARRRAEQSKVGREYSRDLGARMLGVRQTFGPGSAPRSRKGLGTDSALAAFWREQSKLNEPR